MSLRIILPAKPFAEAKQRLAPAMAAGARAALAENMFRHVFATACAFAGPGAVIVVSRGADVLAFAEARGATALAEAAPSDLNAALRQAAGYARAASRLLVVAGDLPLLSDADLATLAMRDCAIAPDRHGHGTNALLWPPQLDFHFGEDSFARHRETARNAGFEAQIVVTPGLGHDVDLPADLLQNSS